MTVKLSDPLWDLSGRPMSGPVILAIDPGYAESAWVLYEVANRRIVDAAKWPNETLLEHLRQATAPSVIVIEKVDSTFGRIGLEVFETVYWTGRFVEAASHRVPVERLGRKRIAATLVGSARAGDADVRHELLDRFGPGRELAVGRKASPGPLYGLKRDMWQALAVAVTWAEMQRGAR